MAKLVIYEDVAGEESIFEDFELTTNRILIGSGPDNHLVLDTPDIDSTHASLELRNDNWIIQDLGGPGGTCVNDNQVDGPHRLQHDDLIELAGVRMRFIDDEWEPVTDDIEEEEPGESSSHISGRVWFATLAGGTIAVIFIIIFLLIVADMLGLLSIADLLP